MDGRGRERGTIVSVRARRGVPAFGGKYVTVWNSWEALRGHALSGLAVQKRIDGER